MPGPRPDGSGSRPDPSRAVPHLVLEVLRFCLVVLFAGVGEQVAISVSELSSAEAITVGPFRGATVGVLLGASLGYVVGGWLSRYVGRSLTRAERMFASRSAEQLLGGLVGSAAGVLAAGFLAWPVLLLDNTVVTGPVFVFVIVAAGALGYRVGLAQRQGILRLIGQSTAHRMSADTVLLDTSVAVDGRLVDVVKAGFVGGRLILTQPVLDELQALADAADTGRRQRGRRGLDTLTALRAEGSVDIEVIGDEAAGVPHVDAKLVRTCLDRDIPLLTIDSNLAKVAALAGCRVRNLHALAIALRPPVVVGDVVEVELLKAGKEAGQAVGYLEDGTMVVVERARQVVGRRCPVTVTSVLITANGRMAFARLEAPTRDIPSQGVPSPATLFGASPAGTSTDPTRS